MSSGLASGTRLKTKTSGLSDFFGGSSQQSNSPRQPPKKLPATPSRTSPTQTAQQPESSSLSKSKKSSIPFWGKRKSSSPSPLKRKPTGNAPVSPPPPVPRLSASSAIHTNNGASSSTSTQKDQPLPSRLPPLNVSPPTLSSKFAAHFTPPTVPAKPPPKSRGLDGSIHAPSPPTSPSSSSFPSPTRSTYRSIPPLPPPAASPAASSLNSTSISRPSIESHRSSTSTTRPTNITVSISPPERLYKDDDYRDKFTLPRSVPTPPSTSTSGSGVQKRSPGTPGSTSGSQGGYFDTPGPNSETRSPSLPSSPRIQHPGSPTGSAASSLIPRSPYPADKDRSTLRSNDGSDNLVTSTKLNTKRSMRKHSISVVKMLEEALGTPVATDLDSEDESDSNTIPTSATPSDFGKDSQQQQTEIPPRRQLDSPIATSTSKVPSIKSSNSSMRSFLSTSKSGPPPTTPLPSPPSQIDSEDSLSSLSSLPTIPSMNSLPSRRSSALIQSSSIASSRPRAKTISAVPPPNPNLRAIPTTSSRSLTSSASSSRRHSRVRPEDAVSDDRSNKENKHKPTYEELEIALAESQGQYATLTAYLKTVSEKLEREKAAAREDAEMWKKEADLWRHEAKSRNAEVKKRDVEIEGLKWLILHPMPPADKSKDQQDDDDASTEAGSLAPSVMFSSDSGSIADADGLTRPETSRKRSMTIHDFRSSPQKSRRPKTLQASSSNNSTTGLGLDFAILDVPYTKWTMESGVSGSSSAASSTSSLAVPGLTATNTVSSGLSAIPESPSHRPLDATAEPEAQKQRERDERRSSRILRRVSGSSLVSSAAIASHAYANNMKTGRGPSIEQVLDHAPPNMDEVLEKLRPFGSS